MVGTNTSTKKHKFYDSTVQDISIGGGDCATDFGYPCACFIDMGAPVKNQAETGLHKLFDLRYHTIDVYDQSIFTLKYSGIHYEEVKKINISYPLTLTHMQSGHFCLSLLQ